MITTSEKIDQGYELAREKYVAYGIDTDAVIAQLGKIQIALHCWQGDDVAGFENPEGLSGGGIPVIFPGRPETAKN